MADGIELSASVAQWVEHEPAVEAAVLYGSTARAAADVVAGDNWSDVDLHIITPEPRKFQTMDWARIFPAHAFRFWVNRAATGDADKITVVFAAGQIDLVVLDRRRMRFGRWAMRLGLHRRVRSFRSALDEMATSMRSGHRFLKGGAEWGAFYAGVVEEMPGVRVSDREARALADTALIFFLLALQRLDRGELVAAQHALHGTLVDTNLRLLRELQLRRGLPLPSFGLGRRAEALFPAAELAWVRVSARLEPDELRRGVCVALEGLTALMRALVPDWQVPAGFREVFERFASANAS